MDVDRVSPRRLRVLLACEPALLREIVAGLLAEDGDLEVIDLDAASRPVDVAVVSVHEASRVGAVVLPQGLPAHEWCVVLDPSANMLRVLACRNGETVDQVLPGTLDTLVAVLRWATLGGGTNCEIIHTATVTQVIA